MVPGVEYFRGLGWPDPHSEGVWFQGITPTWERKITNRHPFQPEILSSWRAPWAPRHPDPSILSWAYVPYPFSSRCQLSSLSPFFPSLQEPSLCGYTCSPGGTFLARGLTAISLGSWGRLCGETRPRSQMNQPCGGVCCVLSDFYHHSWSRSVTTCPTASQPLPLTLSSCFLSTSPPWNRLGEGEPHDVLAVLDHPSSNSFNIYNFFFTQLRKKKTKTKNKTKWERQEDDQGKPLWGDCVSEETGWCEERWRGVGSRKRDRPEMARSGRAGWDRARLVRQAGHQRRPCRPWFCLWILFKFWCELLESFF